MLVPVLLLAAAVLLAGCSQNNGAAPSPTQVHPQGWLAGHGADPEAQGNAGACAGCHGSDFTGRGKAVSCFSCHVSGPPFTLHVAWWNGDALQGHQHFHNAVDPAQRLSWTTCAAAACHGPDLRGTTGGPAPSCFSANFTDAAGTSASCHGAGPPAPHPLPYSDPALHGADAKDAAQNGENLGDFCINCHGRPTNRFDGGFVADPAILGRTQADCSACHTAAGAHPTAWVRADNPVRFHSTVSTRTIASACALCHNTQGPGAGPQAGAPSCFSASFTNTDGTTASCHPTGPGGAPHAVPFTDPAQHGPAAKADLVFCQGCHATAGGPGSNPRFNVPIGNLQNGCEDCHAPGTAHPSGGDRWTFYRDPTASRYTHFAAGNVLSACALCHNVSAGDSGGTAPPCTGCHVAAPQFRLKCDACHQSPPDGASDASGAPTPVAHGGVAAIASHETCALCHGANDDGSGQLSAKTADYRLFDPATPALAEGGSHLDGKIEMNGPAGVGTGYNATNFGCDSACHFNDTSHRLPNASGLPVAFGNFGSGSAACDTCHGYPPDGSPDLTGATPVDHRFGDQGASLLANHNGCLLCHGDKDDGTGAHSPAANYNVASDHHNGSINLNAATQYNAGNFGCDLSCHGNNPAHQFPNGSGLPVVLADYGGSGGSGACSACHDTGVGGAPIVVQNVSSHASGLTCEDCHTGHGQGPVIIPDNARVGIDYVNDATHKGGISLGGAATSGTTEAEICWNCHAGQNVSEWGIDSDTNGPAPNYDFGHLSQPDWVGATWSSAQDGSSGKADFRYKTGPIMSTHSANASAGVSGVDAVSAIRCSYCHDVHNLGAQGLRKGYDNGGQPPYLCGTWMGNPYREDGAPLASSVYNPTLNRFGAVPRGSTVRTELGGYQIDQNNGNPTSTWTADGSAGLCEFCHGNGDGTWTPTEIDNLNVFGNAADAWVGSNGHSNAVLGGSGALAANIFRNSLRSASPILYGSAGAGNPTMAYQSALAGPGFGFRSTPGDPYGWNLDPQMNSVSRPYAFAFYNWGATVDENTTDHQYHHFSCSKCHNPHASRLPRLMISNCLDTKHNTWDDPSNLNVIPTTPNVEGTPVSPENKNTTFSNATQAQNCHRLSDPAQPQAMGSGWNRVTPWGKGGGTAPDNGTIP